MWSSGVVLIVELFVCLQRAQGYPKIGTMDQYLQTRPVPPRTARQAMPSTGKFFHCLHGCWLLLGRHLLEHISAMC